MDILPLIVYPSVCGSKYVRKITGLALTPKDVFEIPGIPGRAPADPPMAEAASLPGMTIKSGHEFLSHHNRTIEN
jgi:hypothetical protein